MNYIDTLTQEEKKVLCGLMTGKELKELFISNERAFSQMQGGFRAKKLKEEQALHIAINNVNKPLIADGINHWIDFQVKKIQKNIKALEEEGTPSQIALPLVLQDSVFTNNIELFLKFAGEAYTDYTCERLSGQVEIIKLVQKDHPVDDIQDKLQDAEKQIISLRQDTDDLRAKYEPKLQEITLENNNLTGLLAEAQKQITALQNANARENNTEPSLQAFDDTNLSVLPSINDENFVSLCRVKTDYTGQKWLIRHADLSHYGRYHAFHKRDDIAAFFANRDKLFYRDGPGTDGFYGIWIWSAVPNKTDPNKDYIETQYTPELSPIEIFFIPEATGLDFLVSLLKNGIDYHPHSNKVMFSYHISKGQYTGILCDTQDLCITEGKTTFSADCILVPVYTFANDDILYLDNGLSFYKKAFAGLPKQCYYIKNKQDIVKDIVLSSISWPTYKQIGASRTEYKEFKNFLNILPAKDIMKQIETMCHCSCTESTELLADFMKSADDFLNGDSLEDELILAAVSSNATLQEKTKALIYADWEKENTSLLQKAQEKLSALETQIQTATVTLSQTQEAYAKAKQQEAYVTACIAEKEKLAVDVENAVNDRIQKARENAADFIANMAFIGTQPTQAITLSNPESAAYRIHPVLENLTDLEAHHTWTDVIHTVAMELDEAGVMKTYDHGLAAFLCAAYIEKQPILLAGPNAIDIAQAFGAAVTAHEYGLLCCEGDYSNQVITSIGANHETIVIINNLFASGWMNRLPELLSHKDIFYIVTHPYAEDIQVEPKSLYGFMLPLFTEFFVDAVASGKYYGGYFAEDFQGYTAPKNAYKDTKDTRKDLKVLSKFRIGSLVKSRINRLVATIHDIHPTLTEDEKFLFAVLPIAYASLAINELAEAIDDPQKGIVISDNLKRDLRYVLGEN